MEEKNQNELEKVLSLALDLGKGMVQCGAEINRVEETVLRICYAYNIKKTEVFSVISMVYATVISEKGETHTQMRRIYSNAPNFRRLENLNALSRKICAETPDIDRARKDLEKLLGDKRHFDVFICLGYIVAAMSFAVFFGGSLLDAAAAAPIALILYLMNVYIKSNGVNRLFFTALSAAVIGFLAEVFVHFGFGHNADMIMIGDVMLIIPGLMLINSVREMLCGDVMSGLLRLLESIILAMAIACGFAASMLLTGSIL
ncbi:MAG: threonine/serine exporter family protein [Clostridia bacterium]|nr:threonine/serine exporter family protein [Clostridia bacterium]